MESPKCIASVSFGKDSLATILLAKEHGDPLDEAVYCEVMFDKGISGEVPEHRDFIYGTAIPRLEDMGVKVVVLRSAKTYVELFTGRVTRSPKKGMVRSFPLCGKCAVQRDCKIRPIQRYQKTLPAGTIQYIGVAQDEQDRLLRLECGRQVSLLEKYNFTEKDAWEFCRKAGLLSPVYAFTDRGGCWFCPNAKWEELRHLYDHHPDLWARMLALQAIPGKTTEKILRQITAEAINCLELGGQVDHPSIKKMESAVDLIAKAWGLPQEVLQGNLDLIQRQKQNVLSGSTEQVLPAGEGLETYDGPMIVELLWGLFETVVKLEDSQDRAAIHELAIMTADNLSLDEWIEACGPAKGQN